MTRLPCDHPRRRAGFTLVEVIVVIVIIGILGGIVAMFIKAPMQSYVDARARAELTDLADLAMRRMARDIRLALPNSVRVSSDGTSIEFLLSKTGGRYFADDDPVVTGATALSWTSSAATTFSIVGAAPIGNQAITNTDYIVVYNLGPNLSPADAYSLGNIAAVSSVATAGSITSVTLASNPFALQNPAMRSPTNRFQVVTGPVSYACSGGNLTRYWNYAIQASQPTPPSGGSSALLSTKVSSCQFNYTQLANTRTGLIGMTLVLQNSAQANAGTVTLVHQIHVDNTP